MTSSIMTIMVLAVLSPVGTSTAQSGQQTRPDVPPPPTPSPAAATAYGALVTEPQAVERDVMMSNLRSSIAAAASREAADIRKTLVIPAGEIVAEDLVLITEDMQVMLHIIDKQFQEEELAESLFVNYGHLLRRDQRDMQAIYLQGYGMLFVMEVSFPLLPPPPSEDEPGAKAEPETDPLWARARQELFSSRRGERSQPPQPALVYDAEWISELRRDLIKSLRHAANIRGLQPDEWVILTAVSESRQCDLLCETLFYHTGSLRRGNSIHARRQPGPAKEPSSPDPVYPASVLTIRVKKSDVDAFAKGDLDFDQFREKAAILTY